MIAEWLQYILMPKTPSRRHFGYIAEAVAIPQRYRRCKSAWQPHLERSKHSIISLAKQCTTKNTALILGSGHLLDVPLAFLSEHFAKVILVDIAPIPAIEKHCRSYENVYLETHDVTEYVDTCFTEDVPNGLLIAPAPSRYLSDDTISMVVSLNLLSQIPLPFSRYLLKKKTDEHTILTLCQQLIQQHLHYIKHFNTPYCLITDMEHHLYDQSGQCMDVTDALYGIEMPEPNQTWIWDIAPLGELSRTIMRQNKVGCFTNDMNHA